MQLLKNRFRDPDPFEYQRPLLVAHPIRKLMLTFRLKKRIKPCKNFQPNNKPCWPIIRKKIPRGWKCCAQNQCSFKTLSAACLKRTCAKPKAAALSKFSAIAAWDESVAFIAHTPRRHRRSQRQTARRQVGRGFYNFDHPETDGWRTRSYLLRKLRLHLPFERPFMGKTACSTYQPQRRAPCLKFCRYAMKQAS